MVCLSVCLSFSFCLFVCTLLVSLSSACVSLFAIYIPLFLFVSILSRKKIIKLDFQTVTICTYICVYNQKYHPLMFIEILKQCCKDGSPSEVKQNRSLLLKWNKSWRLPCRHIHLNYSVMKFRKIFIISEFFWMALYTLLTLQHTFCWVSSSGHDIFAFKTFCLKS